MYKYDLALPGRIAVRVECSLPVFETTAAKLLLNAYLPGVSFGKELLSEGEAVPPTELTELSVRFVVASPTGPGPAGEADFSPSLVVGVGKNSVVLTDFYVGEGSLLDLINLIYCVVRPHWIKRGLYPVHSVCIGDGAGACTLVVGHSGSGKTAIALKRSPDGANLLSGNKTLVSVVGGVLYYVAGTRTMTRAGKDGQPSAATGVVSYAERLAFELGDMSVLSPAGQGGKLAVPIKLIAIARLNDGASSCERLSAISATHRLYPFFIDAVNADTVLCGGASVYSGALNAATAKKVGAALALGTKKVPVIAVTGSMSYVTEALEKNYGGAKA